MTDQTELALGEGAMSWHARFEDLRSRQAEFEKPIAEIEAEHRRSNRRLNQEEPLHWGCDLRSCAGVSLTHRRESDASGETFVVEQCNACGRVSGHRMSDAKAQEMFDGWNVETARRARAQGREPTSEHVASLKWVDRDASARFADLVKAEQSQGKFRSRRDFDEWSRDQFDSLYAEYLTSADWRRLRQKVLKRDGDTCQGCLDAPIQHIHHVTYDRVGAELLFDLIGLCLRCHERAHAQ